MKGGYLIAIEGIDAAGKETQKDRLAKALEEAGHQVITFSSPDYTTPTGINIKEMLEYGTSWSPIIFQSLMVINRYEQQRRVQEALMAGKVIIYDRYVGSAFAYGLLDNCPPQWIDDIQSSLVQPDLNVLIDITAAESFKRKGKARDYYESREDFLHDVRCCYLGLAENPSWVIIDGTGSPDGAAAEILGKVQERMNQ